MHAFTKVMQATPATLLTLLTLTATINADCQSFEVVNQEYCERGDCISIPYRTVAGYNTYRVGDGLVCNDAATDDVCGGPDVACLAQVKNGTFVSATGTWNVTQAVTRTEAAAMFAMAEKALGVTFPTHAETTFGNKFAEKEDTCIPKGESAYVEFVPEYICTQGILRCACGSIPDGTAVEMCAPAYVEGSDNTELAGDLEIIITSPEVASTLTTLEATPTPIQGFPVSTPLPVTSAYNATVTQIPANKVRLRAM